MQHHGVLFACAWPQSTADLLKMHNTGREQRISAIVNVQDAPRSRIDKDEQAMWWPQASINAAAASPSPKRKAGTIECDQAVKEIEKMALHVTANMPHKEQLATFVPWQCIHFAAHLAGKMPGSAYHVPTYSKRKLQS